MRLIWIFFLSLLSFSAWSYDMGDALLNKVSFQLNAEKWVTTKTALVSVGVNLGAADNDMQKVQDNVMNKLKQISDQEDWHMVNFQRNQDASGLEKIQMQAQGRVPMNVLNGMREKLKNLSKAGETYTLDNVQFNPSELELKEANTDLRANIYDQAKQEVDRLNKLNPDQKYYVFSIMFSSNMISEIRPAYAMKMAQMNAAVSSGDNLPMGTKLVSTAYVTLATVSDNVVNKLAGIKGS